MNTRDTNPSTRKTAFACPHCGAYTSQFWWDLNGNRRREDSPLPAMLDPDIEKRIENNKDIDSKRKAELYKWVENTRSGLIFLQERDTVYSQQSVHNLLLSECYNCHMFAVWIAESLLFPRAKPGPNPNQDLPKDIQADFNEARGIASESPRGAAALLRLCKQKLCSFLGESGKHLDSDIAQLVAKGLNPLVAKSLDIVRVIGNEAVHPGTINLQDDPDTAWQLFGLVNAIADQMISHPRVVDEMYKSLPEEKRNAIDERNAKPKK